MGFGFNLFFVFVLIPLIIVLAVLSIVFKVKVFSKSILIICLGIVGLVLFSSVVQWLTAKTILEKDDYYGEYIVNRSYFAGKQADWQYENFRFEIKKNDSIFFHVTDKEKIIETFKGTITTTAPYSSERLIIRMEEPTHHIMARDPTTYRNAWDFYLVFNSGKFGCLF
jgi:hypothetical protein